MYRLDEISHEGFIFEVEAIEALIKEFQSMREAVLRVSHELGGSPVLQEQLDTAIGYERQNGGF